MNLSSTTLTESARSVRLLKIDGCPPYNTNLVNSEHNDKYIASRWEVDGYEWEIRFYPKQYHGISKYMALELVFLSEARGNEVMANLSGRLVDPSGAHQPSAEMISPSKSFQRPLDSSGKVKIMTRYNADLSGYLSKNGSVSMECTVTVFKHPGDILVPSSDLPKDLGELLQSGDGADVKFTVSGEALSAHKNILAARSPVFKAEFFGEMKEKIFRCNCNEVKGMEAAVFKSMLGFIYTDMVLELDTKQETATVMAIRLLVAADRYGLDRLKVLCARKLAHVVELGTAATILALAEQHNCSQLKDRCIEFIVEASPEILDAILATEGFKSLEASLLSEIFMAARGRDKK